MRVFLALLLAAAIGGCNNYGMAEHFPPPDNTPPVATDDGGVQSGGNDAGSVTQNDGGSGAQDAGTVSDGGTKSDGGSATDGGTKSDGGSATDGGTRTCDQDYDDCYLKCKKDHDDRDKDNDDHWKQCLAGDPKLNSKDPDFCNREDRARRKQCKDDDDQCVLKCKKDKDDCKKGGGK